MSCPLKESVGHPQASPVSDQLPERSCFQVTAVCLSYGTESWWSMILVYSRPFYRVQIVVKRLFDQIVHS